jgi:hypothetical protein
MLDSGVVDDDVNRAKLATRLAHHRGNGFRLRHVGTVVADLHVVRCGELRTQPFDLGGIAEAIQDNVGAAFGERLGDAETDTAR